MCLDTVTRAGLPANAPCLTGVVRDSAGTSPEPAGPSAYTGLREAPVCCSATSRRVLLLLLTKIRLRLIITLMTFKCILSYRCSLPLWGRGEFKFHVAVAQRPCMPRRPRADAISRAF